MAIEYEIEIYGARKRISLPFIVGVIADLGGRPDHVDAGMHDARFLAFDRDNLDDRMASIRPRLALALDDPDDAAGPAMQIALEFSSIGAFAPESIVKQVPHLNAILEERLTLAELHDLLHAKPPLADAVFAAMAEGGALRRAAQASPGSGEAQAAALDGSLREQLEVLSHGAAFGLQALWRCPSARDARSAAALVAAAADALLPLDARLSAWVSAILHHPRFQRLEATWRGLEFLLRRGFDEPSTRCRVLNVGIGELRDDFRRSPRYDHSALFGKLRDELRTFGEAPFAMLLVDHAFDHAAEDVELLEDLARLGLALNLVVAAGVAPSLFQMESFLELNNPRDLAKIFGIHEYAAWRNLRDMEASRQLALVLPRMMGREAHRLHRADGAAFNFLESVDDPAHRLWINAAHALVDCARAAFVHDSGFAGLRGVEGGGLVDGLPSHAVRGADGGLELYCPTEIAIGDRREAELAALGLIPLLHCKGTDYAAFFSTSSVCRPQRSEYADRDADARDAALCDLRSVLSVGLVMRHLFAILRDRGNANDDAQALTQRLRDFVDGLTATHPLDPFRQPLLRQANAGVVDLAGDGAARLLVVMLELGAGFEAQVLPFEIEHRLDVLG